MTLHVVDDSHYFRIQKLDGEWPFVVETGIGPVSHANEFLIARFHSPELFTAEGKKPRHITKQTLFNIASALRLLFNLLKDFNWHYLTIDASHLKLIINRYRESGAKENTILIYLGTWRAFYAFLTQRHIEHHMHDLPDRIAFQYQESDARRAMDPYNYAKKRRTLVAEHDPLIMHKKLSSRSDYCENVLSLEEMRELLRELAKQDIVFAAMAAFQFGSCLRISEVCHQVPYQRNSLNPAWKTYVKMSALGLEEQPYHFIAKGQKHHKVYVSIKDMKMVHSCYLNLKEANGKGTCYEQRHEKFLLNYLPHAHNRRRKNPYQGSTDVLWLNENGWPVSNAMYESAFRIAKEAMHERGIALNTDIVSHSMRHSGATHSLWKWSEEQGLPIDRQYAEEIRLFLQRKLGHADMETTLFYIATAQRRRVMNMSQRVVASVGDQLESIVQHDEKLMRGAKEMTNGHLS